VTVEKKKDENDLIAMREIRNHEGATWVASTGDGKWDVTSRSYDPGGGTHLMKYPDTRGFMTVGYGHRVLPDEEFPDLMTPGEAEELFQKDYWKHKEKASKTPGWDKASPRQRRAMINLAFNMGGDWYKEWPEFTEAANKGDFEKAAAELVDSEWYDQVKNRAVDVVNLMRPEEPEKLAMGYQDGGLIRDIYSRKFF